MADFRKFVQKEPTLAYQWSEGDKSIPTSEGVQPVRDGDYIVLQDSRPASVSKVDKVTGKVAKAVESVQHVISIVSKEDFEAEFEEAK